MPEPTYTLAPFDIEAAAEEIRVRNFPLWTAALDALAAHPRHDHAAAPQSDDGADTGHGERRGDERATAADMPPGGPESALSRPEGLKPAYGYLRDDERGSE